jgi:NAD dependent epimerase/dehydratase family enzyme
VLYFNIGSGRLRLRFQIDAAHGQSDPAFEVTFISAGSAIPLFSSRATLSVQNEYRLETELPEKVAAEWEQTKVTDRMPFRLILRVDTKG